MRMVESAHDLLDQRFEILAEAGSGGMGTVYKAVDARTGALAAVKVLRKDRERPDGVSDAERFRREASLLAELRHPGIVSYLGSGESKHGQLYLAMEWLDGEDLASRLQRGVLGIEESLRLFRRLATALQVAHSRGVVHRDLKPSNLFLRQGSVDDAVLLDFGIARVSAMRSQLTATGVIVGTTNYMAPEQVRAQPVISPAADIFSLGCVLFECLTGRPPFVGEHFAAVLAKILFAPAPLLQTLRPGVPRRLCVLVERMLAKDPVDRPADAGALALALSELGMVPEDDGRVIHEAPLAGSDALATVEQQLIGLVLASPSPQSGALDQTIGMLQATHLSQTLRGELAAFGTKAEWMADGTLVVCIAGMSSVFDQALQAARCALLVRSRLPDSVVVLAMGRAVVSDRVPVGEVISRAASLMQLGAGGAESRGVRLDALSYQLLGERFAIQTIAGIPLLHGEKRQQDELRPLLGKPTPCVGRDYELMMCERTLSVCVDESQSMELLVLAPPGVGKSRLRHEFQRRVSSQFPHLRVLIGRGDPMTAGSPYGLLRQALTSLCGIQGGEPEAERQRKLRERVMSVVPPMDQDRVTVFLGELCGVRFPDAAYPALASIRVSPRVLADQIVMAFLDWLRAEAASGPVLLVLEDLHWGDSLTLQLVHQSLSALQELPLMVLSLARPEVVDLFVLPPSERRQTLRLKGLNRRACMHLAQDVLGHKVDAETLKQIVDRADGNALYLEELIRAVSEGNKDTLPETVLAMLQARLTRLSLPLRRLLRVASIFGLTFWQGAVRALLGFEQHVGDPLPLLDELVVLEFVKQHQSSRFPGEREYSFRHPLMRDAAYGLLSESDRRLGHLLAGRYLEDRGEQDAVVLAEHYWQANELDRAATFFWRAAQASVDRNDLAGALLRAERGLACRPGPQLRGGLVAMLSEVHTFRDNWDQALALGMEAFGLLRPGSRTWTRLICRLFVMTSTRAERRAQFEQLVGALCSTTPDPDARTAYVEAMSWLTTAFSSLAVWEQALAFQAMMNQVAQSIADTDPIARAWMCFGSTTVARMLTRDPWQCLVLAEQAASAFTQGGDRRHMAHANSYVGLALSELGQVDRAEKTLRDALSVTVELDEKLQAAAARVYLAIVLLRRGDESGRAEAMSLCKSVVAEPNGNFFFVAIGHAALAQAYLDRDLLADAELEVRRSNELLAIFPTVRQFGESILSTCLLKSGRLTEARHVAESALPHADRHGGYGELAIRLAVVKSRMADGDASSALSALRDAVAQMTVRAATIVDPAVREGFLSGVPECRELQALAVAAGLI